MFQDDTLYKLTYLLTYLVTGFKYSLKPSGLTISGFTLDDDIRWCTGLSAEQTWLINLI